MATSQGGYSNNQIQSWKQLDSANLHIRIVKAAEKGENLQALPLQVANYSLS